jgi:pSer/pThr/pTyr-binding forkhead associated (FHA) protein
MRAGGEPGSEYGLPDGGELKIGRLPGLGITILDTKSSREHARLFHQATGWVVEDLQSRNGTYVNGQRIQRRLLQPRDRVRIGQTEFEFDLLAAGSPIPEAAPLPMPAPQEEQGSKGPAFPALRPKKRRRR